MSAKSQTTASEATIQLERSDDGVWDFHIWLGEEYLGVGFRGTPQQGLERALERLSEAEGAITHG